MSHLTRFSFGATSAIVTGLAFIVSLSGGPDPRNSIIGSLLVFAVADNVADSLGIHVFQESDLKDKAAVNTSTVSNFATRLGMILSFCALVYLLPIQLAVLACAVWGVSVLVVLSYLIAKEQKARVSTAIAQHLAVAFLVMGGSLLLRDWILMFFG